MNILSSDTHRCDARCYDAKSSPDKCRCICGGKNHGIGLSKVWNESRVQKMLEMFPVKEKVKRKKK